MEVKNKGTHSIAFYKKKIPKLEAILTQINFRFYLFVTVHEWEVKTSIIFIIENSDYKRYPFTYRSEHV